MRGGAETLPARFPIFPLRGALLLPGGNLPLNIFEPRYLAMVRDAMRTDRIIGMIQPKGEDEKDTVPEIYGTGCAGRITNFAETPDGRYLIVLTGLCRFDVALELEVETPYRQVAADYSRWRGDLEPKEPPVAVKDGLLQVLEDYLQSQSIKADWRDLKDAPVSSLVTALAMICPFEANEKQALLEASDLTGQAELLTALMQMAAFGGDSEAPGLPN
jgi:Lon protease-like protein